MSKSNSAVEIESILESRSSMFRFRIFLETIFSVESLTFWLESEVYKYLPDDDLVAKAKQIYQTYFSGSPEGTPINLDDMSQELELKKKMAAPDRGTFQSVQGIVWGLLKFECFARFKLSPTFGTKPTKQEEQKYKDDYTIQLLDQFLTIRKDQKKGKTKAPKMPPTEKELNLDENLYDQPDIEEIFEDQDLMLAFREYLYQTHIPENLVFWLETELYRRIDDTEERAQRAQEIVDKFCLPNSQYVINCDEALLEKMISGAKKPTPGLFRSAQKMTWRGLKNEWFPQFCTSDLYKQFDKQELKFSKSNPVRQRANTIDYYEQVVSLKKRLESAGRDFVAEIAVDDALSPTPPPPKPSTKRVVPVPVKADAAKPDGEKKDKKDKKEKNKDKKEKAKEKVAVAEKSSEEEEAPKEKKDKSKSSRTLKAAEVEETGSSKRSSKAQ